jgi:glutaminyl-tRNA synthetase
VSTETPSSPERSDFIREVVAADIRDGRHSTVVTRFPPEPNGTCTSVTRSPSA